MTANGTYLGAVKYVGPSVVSGHLDAKKSAEALLGVDEAIRYFAGAQVSALANTEYEIPVSVRQGSVEIALPTEIGPYVAAVLASGVGTYVATAAKKMAENDFEDVGLQDVFRKSLEGIQWAIRIGKHVGSIARRTFEGVRWRNGNKEVGIPNAAGDLLYVPTEYLDLFEKMPAGLLVKITSVVTEERSLEVVVYRDQQADEVATVSATEKPIFCPDVSDELFPELEHGADFDEEGLVTRGNENANSLGFMYEGHILTCYPEQGNIVRFKEALFLKCRMQGTVTRADKFGQPLEPRPKIIFTSVKPLEEGQDLTPSEQPLFLDDEM